MNTKKLNELFDKVAKSEKAKKIIVTALLLAAFLCIFKAGIEVGLRKAEFSSRFGDRYFRVFEGGPGSRDGSFGPPMMRDVPGGNGAVGRVVRVSLPNFVVMEPQGGEKIIKISNDTVIRRFKTQVEAKDIAVDDVALVLGSPKDGEIIAKFIRLMPQPMMFVSSTTKQ